MKNLIVLSQLQPLDKKDKTSIIEVLKAGKIHDRGLEITEEMLDDYVVNFHENVYGSELQINLGHQREGEAAGWIKNLKREGDRLLAEVKWTPLGIEKVNSEQYKYISSELDHLTDHHVDGKKVPNVFIGAALTNVPAVKGLKPVALNEINKNLNNLNQQNMDKLKEMYDMILEKDSVQQSDVDAFKAAMQEMDLSDAEKEEAQVMVNELESKVEKEEDPEADLKEKEKEVSLNEQKKAELLSEKISLVEEKNKELLSQIETLKKEKQVTELRDVVKKELCLNEKNKLGIKPSEENIERAASFMSGLTSDQQKTFLSLMAARKEVDLSEKGRAGDGAKTIHNDFTDEELESGDAILKLAEAKRKNNSNLSEAEAFEQAEKELLSVTKVNLNN